MRVGGGFGASRTATTVRSVTSAAGWPGNSDAMCVSGPTPSSRTSNGPAAVASSAA